MLALGPAREKQQYPSWLRKEWGDHSHFLSSFKACGPERNLEPMKESSRWPFKDEDIWAGHTGVSPPLCLLAVCPARSLCPPWAPAANHEPQRRCLSSSCCHLPSPWRAPGVPEVRAYGCRTGTWRRWSNGLRPTFTTAWRISRNPSS